VHVDGQLSVADVLRSRRQERLAREAAEEAAAKAAAITVDPQPLELESASEEKPRVPAQARGKSFVKR
jgi:hypothetical protein